MEMLIVFQNPEFRCHLIQLTQLQSTTWHHRDSQQRLLSVQTFMGALGDCSGVKHTGKPLPFWSVSRPSLRASWWTRGR